MDSAKRDSAVVFSLRGDVLQTWARFPRSQPVTLGSSYPNYLANPPRPGQTLCSIGTGGSQTVGQLVALYMRTKGRHRSVREINRIFARYVLPAMGDRTASAINATDVTLLLDSIADGGEKPAPVMARAVAAQLSAFYSWAIPRVPDLSSNPCQFAGKPGKPRPRSRVLSDGEIRALWDVLELERLPWGPAIKLILLTGQRRGEVFNASWREFDLMTGVWQIPAARSKNGRAHRVPLSRGALLILETFPRRVDTDKLFPARNNSANGASGFSKAMARINRAVALTSASTERFTLQDLRRTVATGLQRAGVRLEVTEAVLNHVSGSRDGIVAVYQTYQFEDEKRRALIDWAEALARITSEPVPNNL